ncbi:hypothetical protein Ciccas_014397, partial [Cichlidogyrus casuarinus]
SFIANVIIGGLSKTFGLILENYKQVLSGPDSLFYLTGGLIYTVMLIFSLLTHFIVVKIGTRPVVIIGALTSAVSLIITASVQTIELFVVFLGAGVGLSLSCIYFNVILITGKCFRRYLGVANGISLTGVSLGQMVFPSIITALVDQYSVRGGTYLVAGIFLQMVITGVLMPQHVIDPSNPTELVTEVKSRTSSSENIMMDKYNNNNSNQLTSSTSISSNQRLVKVRQRRMFILLLFIYVLAKMMADVADVGISMFAPGFGDEFKFSQHQINLAIFISGGFDLVSFSR